MDKPEVLFEEKQFIGMNRHSILRRLLFSVFCFVAYYWSENPKPVNLALFRIGEYPGKDHSGQLFFVLGISILFLSALLLFIIHMRTKVIPTAIIIDGFLSARKVRIDLSGISEVKKIKLKPSFFNRPVYNLHNKGRIRFYTHGNEAIELLTRDGIIYRIGTQRPDELKRAIEEQKN
ncbi:MAG TPA: hypothetical protein VFU15_14470 [Bacteroidia bacterium]|nr:hypothetical protein [Bacteroidia bacterium]